MSLKKHVLKEIISQKRICESRVRGRSLYNINIRERSNSENSHGLMVKKGMNVISISISGVYCC
jgi:hypothetical protein